MIRRRAAFLLGWLGYALALPGALLVLLADRLNGGRRPTW